MTVMAALAGVPQRTPSRAERLIGAVLRHPLTMRVKPRVRAAWWAMRGARTRNPELPARVESALFVCLGNICRSPFAAELGSRLLSGPGRGAVTCSSAGIRPSQAARPPADACMVSARYGLSLADHCPQLLTRDLIEAHDLVIVMEWSQLVLLREAYPESHDRIVLLSLFDAAAAGAYERYNIADPFGGPIAAYEACYRRIDRALRALAERMSR